MARRAPRRLDPALDLSRHLRRAADLPAPLAPGAIFPDAAAPCELEVGSGKGLFLLTASGEHPERNYLGVEIAAKYAELAASRLAKAGRANAVVLVGDAQEWLQEKTPDGAFAAIHVYFPDPWWKKRHRKRRIMNPAFLGEADRVLVPGGRFRFWTDVEEYFEEACGLVATSLPWRPVAEEADPLGRTHFDRRMQRSGQPVYRAGWEKPPHGDRAEAAGPPAEPE